jgi:hypothetical protein
MKINYKASFGHILQKSDIKPVESLKISQASIDEMRQFLPWQIDFNSNQDLTAIVFDVAVVNLCNKNGDGICSKGAVKMLKTLGHKPINIEHDRTTIVGHVTNGEFSIREFGVPLPPWIALEKNIPYNLTLAGCLYNVVAKDLVGLIQEIQEGEKKDFFVAASWEIGFEKFLIAKGSNRLDSAEIVTDPAEIEKLEKYLKSSGGKGVTPDGVIVNRIPDPSGEVVFLGAGLTKYPAADVDKVVVFEFPSYEESAPCAVDSISHLKNTDVINQRLENNEMKIEDLQKLIQDTVKESSLPSEAIASMTEKIADAIVESNKSFVQQKEEAEAKVTEAIAKAKEQEDRLATLEAQAKEASAALATANEKIAQFEAEKQSAIAKEQFNQRMSALDEAFELSDSDREIVAKQLSAVSSDEEFQTMKAGLEVLMSAKLKTNIAAVKAEEEAKLKEAVASELKARGIEDPLTKTAPEGNPLPNNAANGSEKPKTLREQFSTAFAPNKIKVTI